MGLNLATWWRVAVFFAFEFSFTNLGEYGATITLHELNRYYKSYPLTFESVWSELKQKSYLSLIG